MVDFAVVPADDRQRVPKQGTNLTTDKLWSAAEANIAVTELGAHLQLVDPLAAWLTQSVLIRMETSPDRQLTLQQTARSRGSACRCSPCRFRRAMMFCVPSLIRPAIPAGSLRRTLIRRGNRGTAAVAPDRR